LTDQLGWPPIDFDLEFCRLAKIVSFLAERRAENLWITAAATETGGPIEATNIDPAGNAKALTGISAPPIHAPVPSCA
jgi:hypothetical protein